MNNIQRMVGYEKQLRQIERREYRKALKLQRQRQKQHVETKQIRHAQNYAMTPEKLFRIVAQIIDSTLPISHYF